MKRKLLAIILAVTLCFSLNTPVIAEDMPKAQSNGFISPIDNTIPPNAVLVSTPPELAAIGGADSAGRYYVLTNDIYLTEEWVPGEFHGTFDGQGHVINNLYVLSSSEREYAGLFGQASEHAIIKNVGVNIGILGLCANGYSNAYVGTLIGKSNGATIINCYITGNISSATTARGINDRYSCAGGLIGYNNGGTITDCYTTGSIAASSLFQSYAGGLIGYNNGNIITNCYTTCKVEASATSSTTYLAWSYAGGLIGDCSSGTITNCYSTGTVSAPSDKDSFSGGLIGRYIGGILTNCYATGDVSGASKYASYVGGLIGYFKDGATVNCYSTSRTYAEKIGYYSDLYYSGGLFGYCGDGIVTVTDSYASGVVTTEGAGDRAGGFIAGYSDNCRLTIKNSYYTSSVVVGETKDSIGVFVSDWALESVMRAVNENLVPENLQRDFSYSTTRAEFCALAVALYENLTGRVITDRITFVDTNDVNVEKAAAIGAVLGMGDNMFSPDTQLTREQAAVMLSRLADAIGKPLQQKAATFADNNQIAEWAIDGVGQVQATGIMSGVGENTFAPKNPYTREQSITTILRLFDFLK